MWIFLQCEGVQSTPPRANVASTRHSIGTFCQSIDPPALPACPASPVVHCRGSDGRHLWPLDGGLMLLNMVSPGSSDCEIWRQCGPGVTPDAQLEIGLLPACRTASTGLQGVLSLSVVVVVVVVSWLENVSCCRLPRSGLTSLLYGR